MATGEYLSSGGGGGLTKTYNNTYRGSNDKVISLTTYVSVFMPTYARVTFNDEVPD